MRFCVYMFFLFLPISQERLLGAALGSAFVGLVVFEQRKRIYESISADRNQLDSQSQVQLPLSALF